ncbi:sigma-54-dependent transcriptional regulator [Desulfosarcina cetonica]|uniref:sigma-54-dependent transcriptional regulator n=1 Tax=Desulfosarcina cetonica TaxID=90730 RepID=UPI001FED6838|nr:sigma 54-interacting transcriptional regulator [Desulfosarcina cetonica]
MVQFDDLIARQLKAGEKSLPVPFASETIGLLKQRGFTEDEALRYFELSFQLRRAFFFIQQNLVGCSPCMQTLRERLWNNIFTHNIHWYDRYLWNRMEDFSTLILGPTGAGKGTAAAAIGRSGYIPFDIRKGCFAHSFTESLIPLNLSQFSKTLIESELFGHKKGAFTGAVTDYTGVLARCRPFGSIFLDEIGEVDETVQIKLLQVIQERTFTPVGSHLAERFSGRVIAATNRPLGLIRSKKILRDDFFYRLCSDVIEVPSLAQRIKQDPQELKDLLAHTVTRILGKSSPALTNELYDAISCQPGLAYDWPGNVRELEQCVRRILINQRYTPDSLPEDNPTPFLQAVKAGELDAQSLLSGYCFTLYRRWGTYEAVAKQSRLDRRTAKKYIQEGKEIFGP